MIFPRIASLLGLLVLVGVQSVRAAVDWPSLQFSPVGPAISNAVAITNAGDNSGRIFVTQKAGKVLILTGLNATSYNALPFLDLSAKVNTEGEYGLLSIAFPPSYAISHRFYAFYVQSNGTLTISRFGLTSDGNVANAASEEVLLTIPHSENTNHNGGQLQFGPDGFLYIGVGDGGGAGDFPNNAQNRKVLLGKILRIDVEGVESDTTPYGIPVSNPFVSRPNLRGEIWSFGLRNPWRFSFDRQTGELYIGDVGQDAFEEVDFQRAGAPGGANYGWRLREGRHNYRNFYHRLTGLRGPVLELAHSAGYLAITGGYVYRGPASARLDGKYIFGDFIKGEVRALVRDQGSWKSSAVANTDFNISTFGETEDGHLLLAHFAENGRLYLLSDSQ